MLAFASRTWHDWDYIPNAWPVWIDADDGAFLVGEVGRAAGAGGPLDADGSPLDVGQPIAITRVAMVSPTEAWLEGIRVDPRVRRLGVATDLQLAELHWVQAQGARVLRYATGASNEASHLLGARDGIEVVARFRAWWWSPTGEAEEDDDEPSAFDARVRAQATEKRRAALRALDEGGLVLRASESAIWWERVDRDPTFAAGQRLYEPRPWAMQELTQPSFAAHAARGEVIRHEVGAEWAVAIMVGDQLPSEDSALRLAILCGTGAGAAELVDRARRTIGADVRFRVPAGAPMVAGHEQRFSAAGFVTPDWELHILARPMDPATHPVPAIDAARVVLADPPERISYPVWPPPG